MTAASNHNTLGDDALARALRQARHIARCQAVDLDRARLELAATQARATAFARQQEALEQAVAGLQAEQARMTTLLLAGTKCEANLRTEIGLLARNRNEAHRLRQSLWDLLLSDTRDGNFRA
jgi:hypothetical protein